MAITQLHVVPSNEGNNNSCNTLCRVCYAFKSPTDPRTTFELWNPLHEISELNDIHQSSDLEILKFWKDRSGGYDTYELYSEIGSHCLAVKMVGQEVASKIAGCICYPDRAFHSKIPTYLRILCIVQNFKALKLWNIRSGWYVIRKLARRYAKNLKRCWDQFGLFKRSIIL